MHVDGGIAGPLRVVADDARRSEAAGYDAVWTAETGHDPFFPLLLAAEHTERLQLGTAIAVAFARNPMTIAQLSWDLQAYSGGRLLLGLGSQIRPHIERRFSMPWSHPAPRMREFISAVRAIWASWQDGTKLDFRGDFYQHTLMTPFFDPGAIDTAPPKVFLAAVGPAMTRVAADVADGMLVHAFSTERYLREVTLPAVAAGLGARGVAREDFQLSWPLFVVTGRDEAEWRTFDDLVRKQIAFYGSTPAYRPVLDLHGWGQLQPELNRLSKQGRWQDMAALVDDDMLAAFAVVGEPDDLPGLIRGRTEGLVDRISFYVPPPGDEAGLISGLRPG
ncbi:MAG TPA: LLM class F420-dependent oxidoreductase [Acidimicrobiales bacterium]|jgi:probable F420-dependent oxidoreductase|nr:LLM class F420-dependent oxidoreductase [Acidimicrobiales bacterium]